jgi:uncharacterized damage-inducible protein DinB
MSMSAALLPEFDQEAASTRKMLEAVPAGKWEFKPHEKSWTMGQLANHVANLMTWTGPTLEQDSIELDGFEPPPVANNPAELLKMFDAYRDAARASIAKASDQTMMSPWSLNEGGQTMFTMPKAACLRGFMMSHTVHHRAQLGLYLRISGAKVPGMYGPSADETF